MLGWRQVRTGGRLCMMRNCGLCDERRMASSKIGLYSTTRVGSMPQLQLTITLGCTHAHEHEQWHEHEEVERRYESAYSIH